ncbi:MAG: DUF4349 domain-containing protein [Parafilimonas sp.]
MKLHFYCMAIFAMMLYACNHGSSTKAIDVELNDLDQTPVQKEKSKDQKAEEQLITPDTIAINATDKNPSPVTNNNADWDKKIVKTADLQLQLNDYKKFNTNIHSSIKSFGAYIAQEKQEETDYRIENSVTIKVPVDQFDDLVNSFSGDGIKIIEKNISSEDVTGEVMDTKARLQAKLAVREKYLQLLNQAKNMDDILQVQNEINEIQENIEAANGRINYLQHTAAYSTINVSYYQYINSSSPNNEEPGFFTKVLKAFSTGTTALSDLCIFLITIWPFTLGVIVFWIYIKKFRLKKA